MPHQTSFAETGSAAKSRRTVRIQYYLLTLADYFLHLFAQGRDPKSDLSGAALAHCSHLGAASRRTVL